MDEVALAELSEIGELVYAPWRTEQRVYGGGQELVQALEGFEVFITEMDIVDFEAIRDLPGLRVIASCRGNPVNVDDESATAFGVPVIYTPGRNADAVADLTVAFMIMLLRKLPASAQFLKTGGVKERDFAKMAEAYMDYQGGELWRKTVGIIGLGNVGSAVARRLGPFGANVLFYDPYVDVEKGAAAGARKVSFDELLSASDFVSVHAEVTDETSDMINRDAFDRMKKGALFINTARASIVDYDALFEALDSGRLAGTALDVYPVEPPASDDRLVSRDDVITTPHLGGNTREIAAHQGAIVAAQIKKLAAGEMPDHLVNPEVMEKFSWTDHRPEPTRSDLDRLAAKPKPIIVS